MIRRSFASMAAVTAVSSSLCLSGGCIRAATVHSPAAAWVQHRAPQGFVVSLPRGWTVEAGDAGQITVADPSHASFALIQPFLLRQPSGAQQWLERAPSLLAGTFPQAHVDKSEQKSQSPDEAVARLSFRRQGKAGQASLLCSIDGRSGMLYAIAAPADQFAGKKPTLVRVLKSFSFTQPATAGAPKAAEASYVRWTDPKEHAFTAEVPSGWKVSGGLFRFASIDTRGAVEADSPDGKTRIAIGDPSIPGFALPTPMMNSLGLTEGKVYSLGYGVNLIVARYVPGAEFAQRHVQKVLSGCTDLSFTQVKDRPDASQAINRINAQFSAAGVGVHLSTGEVSFTCRVNGEPRSGYCFAGTQITTSQAGGLWYAPYLYGFIAPPDRAAQARSILEHMVRTCLPDPQWTAMQTNIAANTSHIVAQTNAEISSIISQGYESRQRTMDDLQRKWSNTILGVTDVRDPETGETWKVASGHNYYWRQGSTVAGTNTYDRPDINFEPLQVW